MIKYVRQYLSPSSYMLSIKQHTSISFRKNFLITQRELQKFLFCLECTLDTFTFYFRCILKQNKSCRLNYNIFPDTQISNQEKTNTWNFSNPPIISLKKPIHIFRSTKLLLNKYFSACPGALWWQCSLNIVCLRFRCLFSCWNIYGILG